MNKAELVEAVAKKTGGSKKDAEATIDATLEAITESLAGGDKVALKGFGTFQVVERAAREGRNPQTGESMTIPAKKVPKATLTFMKKA